MNDELLSKGEGELIYEEIGEVVQLFLARDKIFKKFVCTLGYQFYTIHLLGTQIKKWKLLMSLKSLSKHKKSERLNLRIIPQNKRLIEQAAALEHATPTDFIIRTIVERAEQVISEQCHFYLDKEKWENLCQALDQPAREVPALRKLASEQTILEK